MLYTRVKDGRYPARFLRPAYYQLAPAIAERDGRFVLETRRPAARDPPAGLTRRMHVALVEPEIPPNTGSIARLCAATGTPLHLIGRLGFSIDDKHLKRAGLDYWPYVDLHQHADWASFARGPGTPHRLLGTRRRAPTPPSRSRPTTCWCSAARRAVCRRRSKTELAADLYAIPIDTPHVRSLNLANAVAIVALRSADASWARLMPDLPAPPTASSATPTVRSVPCRNRDVRSPLGHTIAVADRLDRMEIAASECVAASAMVAQSRQRVTSRSCSSRSR